MAGSRRDIGRSVDRAVVVVRTGLIMGVVVAALALPLAAVVGVGVKASADQINSQAEQLPDVPPAQASKVYAADGTTLISQFSEENRVSTPLARMSPFVAQAIVAAEDARFYDHRGVDLKGIARAFVTDSRSGQVSPGASALTVQYVRDVLRYAARTPQELQAATEQTGARKLRETQLAAAVEQKLSKDEILDRYLNLVYFGHEAYGIDAAARIYFAKSPADLTLPEAAMLAGLVQAPSAYDPAVDPAAATERRNHVLDRMVDVDHLSRDAADQAKGQPIALRLSEPPSDCVATAKNNWGFFCDAFKAWWMQQPAFGETPQERLTRLRRGGYRIVTSLDVNLQNSAQRKVTAEEPASSPFAHGLVAIEPGTGRIRAMAVNRIYSADQSHNGPVIDERGRPTTGTGSYPDTVDPLLGGGDLPGFPAGSTFKLFTMLAALEAGKPLATAATTGEQTMWSGFGKSVNTYFVQLEEQVGADKAVAMAERLGLHWRTDVDMLQASAGKAAGGGAFTLGVADTTPLELADAYATIAADGSYCEPLPVLSITDPDGAPVMASGANPVDVAAPRCHQVVRPEVARAAVDAARCVTGYGAATSGVCGGWSTAPTVYSQVKRPVAGTTGTTDDNRAAWFVGFSPTLSVASFIADPDNPLHAVGSANRDKPIRSAAETLRDALAGTPVRGFTAPDPTTAYGPAGRSGTNPGTKPSAKPRAKPGRNS